MLKKQEILAVYQKGPQAICDLVHHLENQIQDLKGRIEELENRSKKTLQIVINHLLQMVCVSLLPKVCANRLIVKQVAS
ncbi:hypothetical protein ACWKTS_34685 [Bacillus toyonensis]|uniref:hypothetical protein n=1 Tax=Bacillus toyonensis TaxID=155322 RepID=UPI000BF3682B|nr:hypothetical protein [Bacillus toyonensis]PFY35768.1 hypothetical protein COL54_28280 [Bacillus toyonensis]PFY43548.1 hypothetical protein COL55_20220 [Bacillus toyonensis]PFY58429.1 hypothetical protein COL62_33335 [Bacillus toyonensis]